MSEPIVEKTVEEKREEDILKIAGVETRMKSAFWGWYLNPTSPTLMNAYQSALKAGFPEEQAAVITAYKWFKRGTLKEEVFSKAEDVLNEMLKMSTVTTKMTKLGAAYMSEDPALLKIKQDTAKYITSTLGKKDYSMRNELTGNKGGAIETKKVPVSDEEFEDIIKRYANNRGSKTTESS